MPFKSPTIKPNILLSVEKPTKFTNLDKIKPTIEEKIKVNIKMPINASTLEISLELTNSLIWFAGI